MATNLAIDLELLNQALAIGGEGTKKATVNRALREFIGDALGGGEAIHTTTFSTFSVRPKSSRMA